VYPTIPHPSEYPLDHSSGIGSTKTSLQPALTLVFCEQKIRAFQFCQVSPLTLSPLSGIRWIVVMVHRPLYSSNDREGGAYLKHSK